MNTYLYVPDLSSFGSIQFLSILLYGKLYFWMENSVGKDVNRNNGNKRRNLYTAAVGGIHLIVVIVVGVVCQILYSLSIDDADTLMRSASISFVLDLGKGT